MQTTIGNSHGLHQIASINEKWLVHVEIDCVCIMYYVLCGCHFPGVLCLMLLFTVQKMSEPSSTAVTEPAVAVQSSETKTQAVTSHKDEILHKLRATMTAEQKVRLAELQAKIGTSVAPHLRDEAHLIRLLRARDHDVAKAYRTKLFFFPETRTQPPFWCSEMWAKWVQWRKDFGLDRWVLRTHNAPFAETQPHAAECMGMPVSIV